MIRFTARPRGAVHVDIAIRAGDDPHHTALCGNVCMRTDEWVALRAVLERGRIEREPVEIHEPKEDV